MNSVYTVAVTTPSPEDSDEAFQSNAFADFGLMMLSFRIVASQKLGYEGMSVGRVAGCGVSNTPNRDVRSLALA